MVSMTLILLWPGAVLLVRRRRSRWRNAVILLSCLSVRRSRGSTSVSRYYRLRTTRSRLWAWLSRWRMQVFRRSGGRAFTLIMVRADDTLTSPAFERLRGLRLIRYAARNLIAFYWNGL